MTGADAMQLAARLRRTLPRHPDALAAANVIERLVRALSEKSRRETSQSQQPVASTPAPTAPVASPVTVTPPVTVTSWPRCEAQKAKSNERVKRWRAGRT